MNNTTTLNRSFEALTWGMLIIWWGITELVKSMPFGIAVLGFGLILLGLNAARLLRGLPIKKFATTLGILAVIWGGLELAGFALHLPFEIPVFAILLIAWGLTSLAIELFGNKKLEA